MNYTGQKVKISRKLGLELTPKSRKYTAQKSVTTTLVTGGPSANIMTALAIYHDIDLHEAVRVHTDGIILMSKSLDIDGPFTAEAVIQGPVVFRLGPLQNGRIQSYPSFF
jgi:hypothetical protein